MLKQGQYSPLPVEEQVVVIFAGVKGYLDKIDVADITRFEEQLLSEVRAKHAATLEKIREEKKLSDATEAALKALLDNFSKTFA